MWREKNRYYHQSKELQQNGIEQALKRVDELNSISVSKE
jgi:hypothetical protein